MAMSNAQKFNQQGMPNQLAGTVATAIANSTANDPGVAALTALTVTATTGTLPTPNGSVTIANAATPTVAELLEFCVELKAKVDAAVSALQS
ncbi:hypothetical protein D9M72_575530 [compost metagenome]